MALFSIKRTIVAGFITALAIICFFAVYTYFNMQRGENDNRRAEVTLSSLRVVEGLFDNTQEIETGQRGYIISGDKNFLDPYLKGLQQLSQDTIKLKTLPFQSKERDTDTEHLLDLIRKKIAFSAATILLRDEKGAEAAELRVQSAEGKRIMDNIRQVVQKIENEDRAELKKYSDHRALIAKQTTILFFALAGLFILFLALFFLWIRRDVKRRLRAELSVRVQENTLLYKDILDRISDGFMALDKNWNFVYLNKASETTSGRTDLVGKNIWKEFPDGIGNEFYEAYHRAMATQEYVYVEAFYPGFDKWLANDIYPSTHGISIHSKDITEKKKAESNLRQAIKRFDMVANATSDILWEADLQKRTTWWNDNFYEKFGYTKNEEFTEADVWEKLLHPDDKKRVIDNINFILNNTTDTSWIDEYRMRKADGDYADIYDRCYIIRDVDGKAHKIVGSMTDISQLTQTREKLRVTEDRYRIMIEEASDAIFINDHDGKFHDVNRRASEMLGYSEKEFRNMKVEDLIPPDELAERPIMYDELISGVRTSLERNMKHKDGSLIPVDIAARMISEDRIIAIVRDVSERKKTEELIRKSEQELKLIYNASGDVIFLISVEADFCYRFKSVNDTFYKVTGLTEKQVIGKRIDEVIPAESAALVKGYYDKAIKSKSSVQWEEVSEYPTGKKTGVVTVTPVFNDLGECILMVGGVHDITERKKIEEEVRRSKEDFAGLVNSIDGIVWEADAQTFEFSFVSNQAERLLGYPAKNWIDQPTFWADHIHPEDRDWAVNYCVSCTNENRSHEFEYRIIAADGSVLWLRDIVSVILDNNKPVRLRGIMIDITEKKKIDELINDSEEKRRLIMNAALDAIVSIDASGSIIFWNPQAEKIFGWKENEVIGHFLTDTIIPKSYQESHRIGMARYLKTGEGTVINRLIELSAINKAEHEFPIELSIIPVVQKGVTTFTAFIRDITERKKVAAELSLSVERFEAIANATHDALWEWNFETEELWANNMHQQLYGLKKTDPVPRVDEWKRRIHPDDLDKTTSAQQIALSSGISYWESEYRFLKDDNQYITIYDRCYIVRDSEGKPIRLTGSMIDITQRKKNEEEIVKARDIADKMIDSLPGVFYFYDDTGKFIRWNKQFELVTGYTGDEIATMHPTDFFPDDEREYITRRITTVFEEGINDAEANFLTKTGEKILHYFKAVLLNYEGKACLLGSGIDISERKKAEEALRVSERKYKLLFENNPMPMWMLSLPEMNVLDVNEAAITHYGYTRAEFLKLNAVDLRPEEEVARFKSLARDNKPGVNYSGVWRHKKKDGTLIDVEVIAHGIDYENKPARLILANDVTEKSRAESLLKKSFEDIRQLTEHIQKIREEERAHIAREIHDELGQQLTVLKMDVSWLNKKMQSDPIVAERLNELTMMLDGTVKTVRRISSELRPSLLDDLGLVAAMDWHLKEFGKRTGIETLFDEPDSIIIISDNITTGLYRIFQESLTNVARHAEASKVYVSLVQNADELVLKVRDNGKGFDKEKVANKRTLGILGMKERAEMMGGNYFISSEEGKGTTVVVSISQPGASDS